MHPNRREELDLFKSRINLTEYASAQGYLLDRKHSSRNSVAMRGPTGDKVIIARDARDGNWIYFSLTDEINPMQKILLVSAMQKLPRGGTVIAATDNDPGGVNLARKIREIAEEAARQDLCVVDHRPDTEGQDWNDVQRATAPEPKPSASPAGTAGRPTPHLEP